MYINLVCLYHRPLKLRTDGGQTRVRELGSIDLFVVTSLKMNELSPNFEHKHKWSMVCINLFTFLNLLPLLVNKAVC